MACGRAGRGRPTARKEQASGRPWTRHRVGSSGGDTVIRAHQPRPRCRFLVPSHLSSRPVFVVAPLPACTRCRCVGHGAYSRQCSDRDGVPSEPGEAAGAAHTLGCVVGNSSAGGLTAHHPAGLAAGAQPWSRRSRPPRRATGLAELGGGRDGVRQRVVLHIALCYPVISAFCRSYTLLLRLAQTTVGARIPAPRSPREQARTMTGC